MYSNVRNNQENMLLSRKVAEHQQVSGAARVYVKKLTSHIQYSPSNAM